VDCPDTGTIRPETAKPGWWHWAAPGWADMYAHDLRWEDGGGSKPTDSGIDGTGIHAAVTLILEGDLGLKASGLTGALGGGVCPTDSTVYEPICNTWLQAVDWPEFEWSSIQLVFHDLPAGEYELYSYHNHFGCYRGDEEEYTPVTCDCLCNPAPPMPEIRAMSCKEARELPYQAADPWSKLFPGIDWTTGPWPEGVTSIQEAYNVQPQQVTTDAELVPSLIKFSTDGSPVLILYKAGCCERDPVRPGRVGGRGILNAFRLVMSGEIPLLPASDPRPPDGANDVDPNVVLGWSPGANASSHDMYFGVNFDDLNDANTSSSVYQGTQSLDANSYDPCGFLELGTTYYWRIDESNGPKLSKGQVWHFTVDDGKARVPSPRDGASTASRDLILSWTAGILVAYHDIYFGTNLYDVNDANITATLDTYMGRQDLDANTYSASGLEFAQSYYWRIDEVNDGNNIIKGDVWSFVVAEYIVVDDMESYTPGWDSPHPISDGWIYGTTNLTGSALDLGTAPGDPIHQGQQSMSYTYWNGFDFGAGYYSEIEHQYPDPCNWTALGVEALTLYFYGDPNNDAGDFEQMYVGLKDDDGNYAEVRYGDGENEDMNDIRIAQWQVWNIDLQDFNNGGVDLTDVNTVYIGFGDRYNLFIPGGTGTVYFDDISLYPPRCILSFRSQELAAVDLSNNCIVDFADIKMMSDAWLQSGQNTADVYEDSIVNLKDFAVLANSWLEKELWPEL